VDGSDEPAEHTDTSDDEHELLAEISRPLWLKYEKDVEQLVQGSDPNASVQHDVKLTGKCSGRERQVDVFVKGTIAGSEFAIAVECKRYSRPIGIGAVDEFAGKLVDLGVDRGVLYAFSGFGAGATARAMGAHQPKIEIRDMGGARGLIPWPQRIPEFLGFGDCPNPNCYTGDVTWVSWAQADEQTVEAGSCPTCGTWAVRCSNCGDISVFFIEEVECWCGATYELDWDHDRVSVEAVIQTSAPTPG
jgi:hypothetical protein